MSLSNKQRIFIAEYLQCWNATEAAKRAGYSKKTAYSIGQENLKKPEIAQAIDEHIMSADQAANIISEIAEASMGTFFKVMEEWTFYPLPSHEVIDAKEIDILDEDGKKTGEKKISYWVRHVALDMDKLVDPKYAHLVKEFSDSPKNGLGIKLYSKHEAARDILKYRGKLVDKTEISGPNGGAIPVEHYEKALAKAYDEPTDDSPTG